ncbi:MAG: glycosyltransferase family 2 protein [Thiohalospira sp.]
MKILTVISNYNEEKAIVDTITEFLNNNSLDSDLLVIDNCSSDKSIELIKSTGVNYLAHPVNTGGSAGVIKSAFAYAYYHNYDIYCHLDGDNQHIASELPKIVTPLLETNDYDIIIGSRYIKKEGFQSTFARRLGIIFFSKILSKITKTSLTDITSGFRAYNKKSIEYFGKNVKHEIEACVQMLLLAHYAGLKMHEVPVKMRPRISGKSEINLINALKFPLYGFINLVGTLIQKHQ